MPEHTTRQLICLQHTDTMWTGQCYCSARNVRQALIRKHELLIESQATQCPYALPAVGHEEAEADEEDHPDDAHQIPILLLAYDDMRHNAQHE